MQCFNGNPETKRRVLERAREAGARAASGEARKNIFWSRRSWCEAPYVCDKPDCDHSFYTTEIGVPLSIAYSERGIFNELSDKQAGKWPQRFLSALPVGMDSEALNEVWRQLALFVLADSDYGLLRLTRTPEQYDAISRIVELFENRSTDADAWMEAGRNARRVYGKGPDTNYRLDSEPAFLAAGAKACYAAAEFAYAFSNPRYAAEAIGWSAWPHRYRKYAELMRGVQKDTVPADERGMVNVGVALFSLGQWMRQADRCESEGEQVRNAMYEIYADQLIRLIKACARRNSPGVINGALSRIASLRSRVSGWTSRFGRYWREETVG